MVAPSSVTNNASQAMDSIYGLDGAARIKLGVGAKTVGSVVPDAAWQGVASHQDGTAFATGDGVVVGAGVDPATDLVHKFAVDASGNQIVAPVSGALTDRSGTIAGGDQTIAAAKAGRRYFFIQNLDAAEALWINFGVSGANYSWPSIRLDAGASFVMENSFVSDEAIHALAATPGHAFTAKEA